MGDDEEVIRAVLLYCVITAPRVHLTSHAHVAQRRKVQPGNVWVHAVQSQGHDQRLKCACLAARHTCKLWHTGGSRAGGGRESQRAAASASTTAFKCAPSDEMLTKQPQALDTSSLLSPKVLTSLAMACGPSLARTSLTLEAVAHCGCAGSSVSRWVADVHC